MADTIRIEHPCRESPRKVAHSPPTASSTSGYRHPIHALQLRQRPPSASQLTSGTFSHHASVRPQLRQCERGCTMLSRFWPAAHAHVQETAEGQPQKAGKNRSQNADHSEVEYTAVGRPSSFHAKLELHGSSASKLQCKPSRAANRNRSGACGRAFSGISCHHGPAACSRRLPLGS